LAANQSAGPQADSGADESPPPGRWPVVAAAPPTVGWVYAFPFDRSSQFTDGENPRICSSCIPAKEPLSDALKSETDDELIGTWLMEKDDHTRFMAVGRHEHAPDEVDQPLPRGLMSYRQFTLTKDGKLGPGAGGGVFFVSRIKGEKYANVFGEEAVQVAQKQGTWGYPADTAFYLVRYRLEKNTLTLVSPDGVCVKAAINKGAIKGTIRGRRPGNCGREGPGRLPGQGGR
jgi:hypothetical protein